MIAFSLDTRVPAVTQCVSSTVSFTFMRSALLAALRHNEDRSLPGGTFLPESQDGKNI